jgi:hypothetical protein
MRIQSETKAKKMTTISLQLKPQLIKGDSHEKTFRDSRHFRINSRCGIGGTQCACSFPKSLYRGLLRLPADLSRPFVPLEKNRAAICLNQNNNSKIGLLSPIVNPGVAR